MNPNLMQQILVILLCVLFIQLALVNKLHCNTMCYSKLLKIESISSINEINDHCEYIELSVIKDLHTQNSDLSVIQLNVRGLLNKQTQIKHLLSNDNVSLPIDVILLCETWLKPST